MRTPVAAAIAITVVAGAFITAAAQSPGYESESAAVAPGMKQSYLFDPVIGMNAFAVAYPANWHVQGRVWEGTPCVRTPASVFRASSPDGLAGVEAMPSLFWIWGDAYGATHQNEGCLPLDDTVSAKDFLREMSAVLHVEYLGAYELPAEQMEKFHRDEAASNAMWVRKYESIGSNAPEYFDELAAADVRFKNGSFTIRGRLVATIHCSSLTNHTAYRNQYRTLNTCEADTRYVYAPESQFDAVWKLSTGIRSTALAEWQTAFQERLDRQRQMTEAAITEMARRDMIAAQQQFNSQMAVQQQAHEEFLATMQRGTDQSMREAEAIANTQHTIASDWVDYALGQQTVRDPNSGVTSKVSANYGYTWRNSLDNSTFQTHDPNANPNGTLPGTWSRQSQVHGDGSP